MCVCLPHVYTRIVLLSTVKQLRSSIPPVSKLCVQWKLICNTKSCHLLATSPPLQLVITYWQYTETRTPGSSQVFYCTLYSVWDIRLCRSLGMRLVITCMEEGTQLRWRAIYNIWGEIRYDPLGMANKNLGNRHIKTERQYFPQMMSSEL